MVVHFPTIHAMKMYGILWLSILLLSVKLSWSDRGVRRSGPYRVLAEKVTLCDDQGTGEVVFGTKITKTSDGKYMYNNPLYFGYPIDQDFSVFGNGGYRPRYMQHTFKGCEETWKYFEEFCKRLSKAVGSNIEKCPFPAGNYTIEGFEVNVSQMKNLPVMMYNRYKAVITSYYNGAKVGCIIVYVDVVPK